MNVRELMEILSASDPSMDVMIGSNTLGNVFSAGETNVSKISGHTGAWPYVVESAYDKFKVDMTTEKRVLLICKD